MYFKAMLAISTQQLELNPKTGKYEGSNPDTHEDHGVFETVTATTLEELVAKLKKRYDLKDAELFEGVIQLSYMGEHDHRTPKEERVPFIEDLSIHFSRVEETPVTDVELKKLFKGGN